MNTARRYWIPTLSFAFALLIAATPMLMAKKGGGGGRGGRGGGGGGQRYTPPPPDPHVLAINAAQGQLNVAQMKLKQVTATLWTKYQAGPDWSDADKAVADAQAAYDAACTPVLAALADNPDYKTAQDASSSIDAKIQTARDSGDSDQVIQLAQQKMTSGAVVTKMTDDALAADPNVVTTKQKLVAAKAAEDALKQKFQESLASDTDYTAAKQAVDDAQTKLNGLRGTTPAAARSAPAASNSGAPKPAVTPSSGGGAGSVPDVGSTVEGITGGVD